MTFLPFISLENFKIIIHPVGSMRKKHREVYSVWLSALKIDPFNDVIIAIKSKENISGIESSIELITIRYIMVLLLQPLIEQVRVSIFV